MNGSRLVFEALKQTGIDLVLVVPDEWSKELISMIDKDSKMELVYVTREEEGVGIAAGAHLGGRNAALIMQTSGLGNSINALASLNLVYRIPVLILASFRGGPGEEYYHKLYVGLSIKAILSSLGIPCYEIGTPEDSGRVVQNAFEQAKNANTPTVVLMSKRILVGDSY